MGHIRLALEYQRDWGIPSGGPGYLLERPLLERAARDGALGILDGQGGDELFGFSPYLIADRARHGKLRAAVQLLAQPAGPGRAAASSRAAHVRARVRRASVAAGRPGATDLAPRRRRSPHARLASQRPAGAVLGGGLTSGLEACWGRPAVVAPSRPPADDRTRRARRVHRSSRSRSRVCKCDHRSSTSISWS